MTKLQRSQNAHYGLRVKHIDTPGKKGDVLYGYHGNVIKMQTAKKRILSDSEKRRVFETVRSRVYKAK